MKKIEKAKKLANALEYERLKRGMTHEKFSEFLELPRSSVTSYLLGRTLPSAKRINIISQKLNLDIPKLLTN